MRIIGARRRRNLQCRKVVFVIPLAIPQQLQHLGAESIGVGRARSSWLRCWRRSERSADNAMRLSLYRQIADVSGTFGQMPRPHSGRVQNQMSRDANQLPERNNTLFLKSLSCFIRGKMTFSAMAWRLVHSVSSVAVSIPAGSSALAIPCSPPSPPWQVASCDCCVPVDASLLDVWRRLLNKWLELFNGYPYTSCCRSASWVVSAYCGKMESGNARRFRSA
eukprot:scaffold545541_cov48-Prasinocladus_malaysianus.AAC.1